MNVTELRQKLEELEKRNLGSVEVYTISHWTTELNKVSTVNIELHWPVIVLEIEPPENEDELFDEGEFDNVEEI